MKRVVKVKFVDFWENFVPKDSLFYSILSERYELVLSEQPDYIFCSVFGQNHLKYDCIKIFYTGENQSPDFNLVDYAIGFDPIDFGDRYLRFPIYYLSNRDCFARIANRTPINNLSKKTGFCSFVVSNNKSSPERLTFYNKLSEYKKVDSGGRYLNNVGGPISDKDAFQQSHKFSIAFENCSQPGYTTEKILDAFASRTVPIYWGDPDISTVFNNNAFINCHKFSSWDEVIDRVKYLDNNDDALIQMLNTPVFVYEEDSLDAMTEKLRHFLFHIFDQEFEKAYRYNRHYWGKRNIKLARLREKAYRHSPRGIAESLYKKTLWKWRRSNLLLWKLDRIIKK